MTAATNLRAGDEILFPGGSESDAVGASFVSVAVRDCSRA